MNISRHLSHTIYGCHATTGPHIARFQVIDDIRDDHHILDIPVFILVMNQEILSNIHDTNSTIGFNAVRT
jgi:hypothetical protein